MSFLGRLFRRGRGPEAAGVGPATSGQQLLQECARFSDKLMKYVDERSRRQPNPDPPTRDPDLLRAADREFSRHQMDTMSEYAERFREGLLQLTAALELHKVSEPELRQLAEHPANPAGVRRAATLLRDLSKRLDPEIARLEQVYSAPGADVEEPGR